MKNHSITIIKKQVLSIRLSMRTWRYFWRREGDSNSRYLAANSFSRAARSTTLPSLLDEFSFFEWCRERDLVAPPAATRLSSSSKWRESLLWIQIQIHEYTCLCGAEKGIWTLTPYGHTRLRRTCLPFHHLGMIWLYWPIQKCKQKL